jgi:hypothetical protein
VGRPGPGRHGLTQGRRAEARLSLHGVVFDILNPGPSTSRRKGAGIAARPEVEVGEIVGCD